MHTHLIAYFRLSAGAGRTARTKKLSRLLPLMSGIMMLTAATVRRPRPRTLASLVEQLPPLLRRRGGFLFSVLTSRGRGSAGVGRSVPHSLRALELGIAIGSTQWR